MITYESEALYVESRTDRISKINAIQQIQDALLTSALKAAGQSNLQEYMLNDGQTIIKTIYRNPAQIHQAYIDFERIKQSLLNALNGRMVRLVDSKNFYPHGSGR